MYAFKGSLPPSGSHESATTCNTRLLLAAKVLKKGSSIDCISEQTDVTKPKTNIASRRKPGKRAISLYSPGEVSTAIQLSGGGGASLKNGSWGARESRAMLERTGGGSNIVGGAGGGRLRQAKPGEVEGGTGSEKGRREFLLDEISG